MLRKVYYLKGADLRDAVEKLNELHGWINNNIDAVLQVLRAARFKDSGELYKRDHEKMRAILDTTPFRAHIKNMHYSRYLSTSTMSTIKGNNCDIAHYMNVDVLVWDSGKVVDNVARLSCYDVDNVVADIEHSRRMFELANKAVDEYRATEPKISQFTSI